VIDHTAVPLLPVQLSVHNSPDIDIH
jgi:hypothetical protein